MRPILASVLAALTVLAPMSGAAENSVSVVGNYYLERSTRVISPSVAVSADLPEDTDIELTYLVDNITSASGTFQATVNDEPFQEFRQEVRASVSKDKLWDFLRLGISARYSFEPDYTSLTYGVLASAKLFEENTTVAVDVQRQNDAIFARGNNFEDTLDTWRLAVRYSQTLTPSLMVGATLETQFLDGYTENPYRSEEHPRSRERFTLSGWAAYRIRSTRTTVRGTYRYYWDDWDIHANTLDLRVWQAILPSFEVVPQIRITEQSGVNFRRQIEEDGVTYRTSDPKLMLQANMTVGLRAIWTLTFLEGTALHAFRRASIEPRYLYLFQRTARSLNPIEILEAEQTAFGDAHIVQLGLSWPF